LFYRKAVIFILKLTLIFKTNFSIKCIICKTEGANRRVARLTTVIKMYIYYDKSTCNKNVIRHLPYTCIHTRNIELFYRKAVIFILKLTLIFKTNFSIKCIICKYIINCLSLQQSSKYSVLQCLVQMSLELCTICRWRNSVSQVVTIAQIQRVTLILKPFYVYTFFK
jgi:hypothetical protein